jgi:hypothetical protein
VKIILTFVRAVFGYIYSLVGIAFLMTLAPFFLCFFLFRQTRPFFDKWIGYLVSFALQIVILFAFLAFVLSLGTMKDASGNPTGVGRLMQSIPDIIIHKEQPIETTSFRLPWDYCTLCDFHVVDASSGAEISSDQYKDMMGKGKLACKNDPMTGKPKAIDIATAISPPAGQGATTQQSALVMFAGAGLMTLFVLALIVEHLLDYVGSLAQTLAVGMGGYSAPRLGGGVSMGNRPQVGMPGEGMITDFQRGFQHGSKSSGNTVGSLVGGVTEGFSTMIGNKQSAEGTGLKNRFIDWIVDPNQLNNR